MLWDFDILVVNWIIEFGLIISVVLYYWKYDYFILYCCFFLEIIYFVCYVLMSYYFSNDWKIVVDNLLGLNN